MLRSGHKITDVLFYYLIVSQQQYHTPDKRGTTGDWFEYDAVQRNYMRLLSDDEQNKAFKALVKAGNRPLSEKKRTSDGCSGKCAHASATAWSTS